MHKYDNEEGEGEREERRPSGGARIEGRREERGNVRNERAGFSRTETAVETSGRADWPQPWVQLKYWTYAPAVFPRMIAAASPAIKAGAVVQVYDRNGGKFGAGFYNSKARVPLRVLQHTQEPMDDAWFSAALERAARLRTDILKLDATTEAYRVVNSDGDGLSGLTVDRYGDVLCAEIHSLGVWQRAESWMAQLHALLGTKRHLLRADPEIARMEGFLAPDITKSEPRSVRIREHGVRYEVNFAEGHKTGHFCDQRENRQKLAGMVEGMRMLDLCCCTGGFSLAAQMAGKAASVTAVDLDEKAIAQAKRNANLNMCRSIDWVHTDAFTYCRTMIRNAATWDAVVLDPPKLVHSRDEEMDDGRKRYEDLNGLAIQLVKPGGLFVTCSCSGLLSAGEFESIVSRAAHRNKRKLQFIDATGAGGDHPVMSNCMESRYLKVLWALVH